MDKLSLEFWLTFIAVCVFVVTMITQYIKDIKGLAEIRTNFVVLVISAIVVILGLIGVCSYYSIPFVLYMIPVPLVLAFIVAYISMYGWDKLWALWTESQAKKKEE